MRNSTLFLSLISLLLLAFGLAGWASYADMEQKYIDFTRHTVQCNGTVIELNEMSSKEASHWAVQHCTNFQMVP